MQSSSSIDARPELYKLIRTSFPLIDIPVDATITKNGCKTSGIALRFKPSYNHLSLQRVDKWPVTTTELQQIIRTRGIWAVRVNEELRTPGKAWYDCPEVPQTVVENKDTALNVRMLLRGMIVATYPNQLIPASGEGISSRGYGRGHIAFRFSDASHEQKFTATSIAKWDPATTERMIANNDIWAVKVERSPPNTKTWYLASEISNTPSNPQPPHQEKPAKSTRRSSGVAGPSLDSSSRLSLTSSGDDSRVNHPDAAHDNTACSEATTSKLKVRDTVAALERRHDAETIAFLKHQVEQLEIALNSQPKYDQSLPETKAKLTRTTAELDAKNTELKTVKKSLQEEKQRRQAVEKDLEALKRRVERDRVTWGDSMATEVEMRQAAAKDLNLERSTVANLQKLLEFERKEKMEMKEMLERMVTEKEEEGKAHINTLLALL